MLSTLRVYLDLRCKDRRRLRFAAFADHRGRRSVAENCRFAKRGPVERERSNIGGYDHDVMVAVTFDQITERVERHEKRQTTCADIKRCNPVCAGADPRKNKPP